MEVITIVEGIIPASKVREFEDAYVSVKKEAFPPGLVSSLLLKNTKSPQIYRIQTVWASQEALEAMRSSTNTPKAIELFKKVGAKPELEVFEVVGSVR